MRRDGQRRSAGKLSSQLRKLARRERSRIRLCEESPDQTPKEQCHEIRGYLDVPVIRVRNTTGGVREPAVEGVFKVDATRERDVPPIPRQDRGQRRLPSGRNRQPSGSSRNHSQVRSVRRLSG